MSKNNKLVNLINHLKTQGFVYQGSEIYGGLANTWDYGPLGSLLLNNIKNEWIKYFIHNEENNFLIDAKILMNPEVWKTSGHVGNFSDPLIENKINNKRYRADHLIEEFDPLMKIETLSEIEMENFIKRNITKYEGVATDWTSIRKFNLMFETYQGILEDSKNKIYLRPETAQAIFVNFKNILRTTRTKIPFGVGQIGKSFRNEVTPGNFIFRTREFEQMELEYFVHPNDSDKAFEYYLKKCYEFLIFLGIKKDLLKIRKHAKEELSHYSSATSDIEFKFDFGWGELLGVANRGDFDLSSHSKATNEELSYFDSIENITYIPHVIEPSMGLDRLALAILTSSYEEETLEVDSRVVLKLNKFLVPYQIAVLPLVKKFSEESKELVKWLKQHNFRTTYDESASIGKRYRRQDAIGTFFALTYDYQSAENQSFTIRNRDTMEQIRINKIDLISYLTKELNGI
ncbi:glycine--tRNA ligase [[Mycoplasma] mobile]|uniref:glycine--tRNA ligase n=1 Tax=Mycoplasma mobile (strain ATCC 43663 / 163K / NCTC 11711) TaxID=267748 RepID=Q6KHZ8_MYCM1|nr:glycine--tRNA ligase [[Mycoplasma] mobile]AAT27778.1 glycyl-tRNA synthetase [Mycoplasma mobile 163K]